MTLEPHADGKFRCPWCGTDELYVHYHDTDWGVPEYDSRALFEKLILDGFQAGLSWITILRKRENFRAAFDHFEPAKIARYRPAKLEKLLLDPGIIRHKGKIAASVSNAQAYLALQEREAFHGKRRFATDEWRGLPAGKRASITSKCSDAACPLHWPEQSPARAVDRNRAANASLF